MKKILLFCGLESFCLLANAQQSASDTMRATASIPNATVYFGYGAELTHQSKIKVDQGTRIIVIDQLSTNIDINSLQISVPEDIALLSYKYNIYYPVKP